MLTDGIIMAKFHVNTVFNSVLIVLCARVHLSMSQGNNNDVNGVPNSSQSGQECPPGSCPPQWIGLLNEYSWMLSPQVMQPVCASALQEGFLSSCSSPQRTCGKPAVGDANFCCCPAHQLSKVQECLPQSKHICIPDTFTPWQAQLQTAIFSLMG